MAGGAESADGGAAVKFASITWRLAGWFAVVAMLPLAMFGYLSLRQHKNDLRTEALGRLSRLADKKTMQIKAYLNERVLDVQLLARSSQVEAAFSAAKLAYARHGPRSAGYGKAATPVDAGFSPYIGEGEEALFYDAFLITPGGEVVYTYKREPDFAANLLEGALRHTQLTQAFRESRMTYESSISDFEYYAPSGAPAAFISAPVIREGRLLGVFAMQLDTQHIYRVALDNTGLGVSGETHLAKLTGGDKAVFVAPLRSDPQAALQHGINLESGTMPTRKALTGQRGAGVEMDYAGKQVVAAWRYLPELRWGVVVKMDADEVFAPLREEQESLLEALLALMLFAAATAFYFGWKLIVPLKGFASTAAEIAQGDLGKRVDESRADEIGMLGRAFNRMAEKLQASRRFLEERVEERTRELNASNALLKQEVAERKQAEEELKQTKARYDYASEIGKVGTWDWYPGTGYLVWNEETFRLLDLVPGSVTPSFELFLGVVHPDDREFIKASVQAVLNERKPYTVDCRLVTGSGGTAFCHIEGKAEYDTEGNPVRMLGTIQDITGRKQAEERLKESEERLSFALQGANDGLWDWNLETNEVYYSPRWLEMLGYLPGELPQTLDTWATLVHPEDKDKVLVLATEYVAGKRPGFEVEFRMRHKQGHWVDVLSRARLARDRAGQLLSPRRLVGTHVDISERKRAESELRIAAVAFETDEAILITDARANIIRVNRAFTRITGYRPEEVLGKNPRILSSGRMSMEFYARMWKELLDTGTWSGEIWDRRKSGEVYPKWMNITALKNEEGDITEFIGMFSDITARKRAEEEIRNLAFYDALTGLPNRRLLLDHFHLALAASERNQHYGAALFLDMDRFKLLNDTLGHDHGDLLLLDVAKRIQACVREADTVARLGGDEFVVLVEGISTSEEEASQKAAVVAEKIRQALCEAYRLKGHEYHSSPSIGVTLFRGIKVSIDELLKYADLAMYQAKEAGRNAVRFFDPAMQRLVQARANLETDLRHAIAGNELLLYYQIQVDGDIHPVGAEALLRWVHPKRGMISPARFIPIAEDSTLILELGQWVLDSACRQLASWSRREPMRNLDLAINVSAKQFAQHDFVRQVEETVRRHGIAAERLKLELTESVVLKDVADVVSKMHALKAIGVKLSLDDFGTGYSSLSYLKKLPLDQIKIDQGFVRDATSDPNDAVMVKTIIDMAQNFRLNVIAEGVETAAQLTFLRESGCMAYQGYLFGKPAAALEFERVLQDLRE
jgi:diguanylate cyclase (GGDEF)-like protein/PAS domain S-box-containing protein